MFCVDLVTFRDAGIIDELYLDHLRNRPVTFLSDLRRFRIGLRGDAQEERLSDVALEFPRIQ